MSRIFPRPLDTLTVYRVIKKADWIDAAGQPLPDAYVRTIKRHPETETIEWVEAGLSVVVSAGPPDCAAIGRQGLGSSHGLDALQVGAARSVRVAEGAAGWFLDVRQDAPAHATINTPDPLQDPIGAELDGAALAALATCVNRNRCRSGGLVQARDCPGED